MGAPVILVTTCPSCVFWSFGITTTRTVKNSNRENQNWLNSLRMRRFWRFIGTSLSVANGLTKLLAGIESCEATQCQLADELGKNYVHLKGAQKGEQAIGGSIRNATILKCERRKHTQHKDEGANPACHKTQKNEYLRKYNPACLALPENEDLTYSSFLGIKIDDLLWKDGHFYHVRALWSIDPLLRRCISLVLTLDQVKEEVDLLTQELDQAMTWAHQYPA
ncbi:hypothetical protein VP01_3874g2 [Puccinia sorghi]|uniref:Uncharacterized protein n=1 Tax=Puccinia sorghi TaxID=27349 RepID=A0A0L6UT14_9BASI|nr:hypothetical protein VP01_3874g2 [Puccinia sorghi]